MNFINKFQADISMNDVFMNSSSEILPVYIIDSFHLLTQFIGYGKYINRNFGNVYLRGQSQLYPAGLQPSLLRGAKDPALRIKNQNRNVNKILERSHNFKEYKYSKLVPLLQHYGFKTQWLDIVDNLWVAIWFSLHDFNSFQCDGMQHVHISERKDDTYAYVFLIATDATCESQAEPGIYKKNGSTLVDLRKFYPSTFLRPHAQHGLMIKKTFSNSNFNYNNLVIGIAKFKTSDGFKWIGRNGLMSIQSLFPPTYYDTGYRLLLENFKVAPQYISQYGSIQLISY